MDVYTDSGAGTVALSVGSGDAAASVLTATAEYTGSGAWQTLYFDFSAFVAGTVYDWLKIVSTTESPATAATGIGIMSASAGRRLGPRRRTDRRRSTFGVR